MVDVKERNYQISEIANIFGVSKEMIRHYEKQHIINPERIEGNNYRAYSSKEIFSLCEMMQNKEWDISLKKIAEMKENEYTDTLIELYKEALHEIEKKYLEIQCRKKRLEYLIQCLETCRMNIGNFWIEKSEAGYWFEMMEAEGDMCSAIKQYEDPNKSIYRSGNIVFMDCMCIKRKKLSEWGMFLNEEYLSTVSTPVKYAKYYFNEELCFCTIVDMGELGKYDEQAFDKLTFELHNRGYVQTGDFRGIILSRGVDHNMYRRYLKIMVPCQMG